jgi:hypothetical protein
VGEKDRSIDFVQHRLREDYQSGETLFSVAEQPKKACRRFDQRSTLNT